MSKQIIRVVAAVFNPAGTDEFIPSLRFVDPDQPEDACEFFRVETRHVEALIAQMRRSQANAEAYAAELLSAEPAARELAMAPMEGRA